jgi:hypothetical protein
MLPVVKSQILVLAALILALLSSLSCGSNSQPTLNVEPRVASAWTNYEDGTVKAVDLTATLSNGAVPTGVQWTTSDGCVAIDPSRTQDTNTVVCNFTCDGSRTGVITATAQGISGTSTVSCTWITGVAKKGSGKN